MVGRYRGRGTGPVHGGTDGTARRRIPAPRPGIAPGSAAWDAGFGEGPRSPRRDGGRHQSGELRPDAFPHPERIAVDKPSAKQMLKVNPRPFKFQDERYANLADEPFDSDAEYEVDRIIGKKTKRGKVYYQVLWKD